MLENKKIKKVYMDRKQLKNKVGAAHTVGWCIKYNILCQIIHMQGNALSGTSKSPSLYEFQALVHLRVSLKVKHGWSCMGEATSATNPLCIQLFFWWRRGGLLLEEKKKIKPVVAKSQELCWSNCMWTRVHWKHCRQRLCAWLWAVNLADTCYT